MNALINFICMITWEEFEKVDLRTERSSRSMIFRKLKPSYKLIDLVLNWEKNRLLSLPNYTLKEDLLMKQSHLCKLISPKTNRQILCRKF